MPNEKATSFSATLLAMLPSDIYDAWRASQLHHRREVEQIMDHYLASPEVLKVIIDNSEKIAEELWLKLQAGLLGLVLVELVDDNLYFEPLSITLWAKNVRDLWIGVRPTLLNRVFMKRATLEARNQRALGVYGQLKDQIPILPPRTAHGQGTDWEIETALALIKKQSYTDESAAIERIDHLLAQKDSEIDEVVAKLKRSPLGTEKDNEAWYRYIGIRSGTALLHLRKGELQGSLKDLNSALYHQIQLLEYLLKLELDDKTLATQANLGRAIYIYDHVQSWGIDPEARGVEKMICERLETLKNLIEEVEQRIEERPQVA